MKLMYMSGQLRFPIKFLFSVMLWCVPSAARAIVLDPSAGQMPPPANGFVDRWNGSSAVMIGPHWILTAHHTGGGVGSQFWIGNTICYATEYYPAPGGVDLGIARIGTACNNRFTGQAETVAQLPGWHEISDQIPANGQELFVGGWGRVTGTQLPDATGVQWGGGWGLRWGKNKTYGSSGSSISWTFDRPGTGDSIPYESIASMNDSGGGVFVRQANGQLALVGIIYSASIYCGSTPDCSPYGGGSWAREVTSWRTWIASIIGASPTPTPTATRTSTPTATPTQTFTATPTATRTPISTATSTATATETPDSTSQPMATFAATPIVLVSVKPTLEPYLLPATPTASVTATPTPTPEILATASVPGAGTLVLKARVKGDRLRLMVKIKNAEASLQTLDEAGVSPCLFALRVSLNKKTLMDEAPISLNLSVQRVVNLNQIKLPHSRIYLGSDLVCHALEGSTNIARLDMWDGRSGTSTASNRSLRPLKKALKRLSARDAQLRVP